MRIDQKELDALKAKILEAQDSLQAYPSFLEKLRELLSLWGLLNLPRNEPYMNLLGIDSQTDHIHLGNVRTLWNIPALAKLEKIGLNLFCEIK